MERALGGFLYCLFFVCFHLFLLFISSSFVLDTVDFVVVLSCVLPLIYHISNYIQF